MIHALKIESEYFDKIAAGVKPYELRYNDRNYQVGDFLALNEITDKPAPVSIGCTMNGNTIKDYTGRCMLVQITDIYKEDKFSLLKENAVILSILPCKISRANSYMFEPGIYYNCTFNNSGKSNG